ncbi:MAG: CCA tRNA nucleotidyltransferase [Armatimonadetes bacterium]|nr:CCA tRNA nucleotidyltransferase [Armatimonadota bacterium]
MSEEERAWLARLGEVAHAAGARAWLVGGPVRDLLLGAERPDTDLVIEGPVEEVARALADELGGRVRKTTEFLTSTVALESGGEIDIAHARTERYDSPGALPTVEAAGIDEDLARRDFTVNAMALALSPGEFGELLDPHGGRADLQAGLLRVLHERSFEDDPTRMLRAVRFAGRLELRLERHTAELLRRAAGERRLETISGARLRNELRRLFRERSGEALGDLQALGLMSAMGLPEAGEWAVSRCRALPAAVGALALDERQWRPLAACLGIYAAGAELDARELSERLMLDAGERTALIAAARLSGGPPEALDSGRDSEVCFALEGTPPSAAAALWAAVDGPSRARVETWWRELRHVRADVTGHDLINAGFAPDPTFAPALRAALAAKLDRGADRDEQMRAALQAMEG